MEQYAAYKKLTSQEGYSETKRQSIENDIPINKKIKSKIKQEKLYLHMIKDKTKNRKTRLRNYCIMIKVPIHQEDVMIINLYTPNLIKQTLLDLTGGMEVIGSNMILYYQQWTDHLDKKS
jgi:hypothetical protein